MGIEIKLFFFFLSYTLGSFNITARKLSSCGLPRGNSQICLKCMEFVSLLLCSIHDEESSQAVDTSYPVSDLVWVC